MTRSRTWVVWLLLAAAVVAIVAVRRWRVAGTPEEAAVSGVAVRTGTITRATLRRYVTAYGRVEPRPPSAGTPPAGMTIGSQVMGVLVGIDCAEGQRVEKGAVLFRLDSRVAEVAVDRAKQNLEFARKTFERQKELLPAEGTSRRAYLEAEQRLDAARNDLADAEAHLALHRITAPLNGTVVRIDARLGQSVDATTILAQMIDYRRLVVSAGVPSREAALLRPGQSVEIDDAGAAASGAGGGNAGAGAAGGGNAAADAGAAGGGEAPLPGSLIYVGRDIDPATDTVVVRASLPESVGLAPGRFLPIRIVAEEHRDRLVVPVDSLVTRAGEGTWIVLVEGDRAVRKPVTAGLRDGGLVEIDGAGLKEGMAIVTDDAYSLPAETTIRVQEH